MSTFLSIAKKILNTEENIFSVNYKKTDNIEGIIKILFHVFTLNEIKNVKQKYTFFADCLKSPFLKDKTKTDEFIFYFCKIQKLYNGLNRFAWNYKYNKAKIVVDTDMCLNKLNIGDKNVICLFHNQSRYLFHISDIINISNSALSNAHSFFAEPLSIKNPYNNLPFNKSTLYNIYLFIKYKTYYNAELFTKFFYSDFNLTCFKGNYEYLLREHAINNYVYKSPSNILLDEIKVMLQFYNDYYDDDDDDIFADSKKTKKGIHIDEDFPKNTLIKIMRPYLLLFCKSSYSFLPHKKREYLHIFIKLLDRFKNFNPRFGRKRYKILLKKSKNFKLKVSRKILEFDDKHIQFNNVEIQNNEFLKDHLSYEDYNYFNDRTVRLRSTLRGPIYSYNYNDNDTPDTPSLLEDTEEEFGEDTENTEEIEDGEIEEYTEEELEESKDDNSLS